MEEQARAVRLIELTLYPYCMNVTSDRVIYYYSHCSILLFYLPPPLLLVPDRDTGYEQKCRQNLVCQRAHCIGGICKDFLLIFVKHMQY